MNRESKFAKAVRLISNICVFVLPILVILYFLWLQNIQLIILINYKIILFGCDLILWIVFLLNLVVLAARKRIALGIILFLMTAPCLTISSLCLIGFLPGYSPFVSNLPQIDDHIQFEKILITLHRRLANGAYHIRNYINVEVKLQIVNH